MTPKSILVWSALGSILLLANPARAQFGGDEVRPYVTLTAGVAFTPDLDSNSFAPLQSGLRTEGGPNLTIGGGVGALWGYVRHEVRADYHRATVESVTPYLEIVSVPVQDPAGETMSVTTLLYSVGLRQPFFDDKFAVYGMIGIGAAYGNIPTGAVTIQDWQFGYSVNVGGFYDVWRNIGVDLGYRYVGATQFSGTVTPVFPAPPPPPPINPFSDGSFPFNLNWRVHEVVLSLRYSWGGDD